MNETENGGEEAERERERQRQTDGVGGVEKGLKSKWLPFVTNHSFI